MIIVCPNCQFSGHVPDSALASPHRARCLHCHFRFDVGVGSADRSWPELTRPAGLSAHDSATTPGGLSPSSSSYELEAMGGEDSRAVNLGAVPALTSEGPKPGGSSIPWRAQRIDAAAVEQPPTPQPSGRPPAANHEDLDNAGKSLGNNPWYARVLEVWGVLLLLWAFWIMLRSLVSGGASTAPNGSSRGRELVFSALAVSLLAPGAGSLFLLGDLGRYVRRLSLLREATGPSEPARGRRLAGSARRLRQVWSWSWSKREARPGSGHRNW